MLRSTPLGTQTEIPRVGATVAVSISELIACTLLADRSSRWDVVLETSAFACVRTSRLHAPAKSVSLAAEANSLDTLASNARLKSESDA